MRPGTHETTPSIFEVVRRAVDIVDPEGVDDDPDEILRLAARAEFGRQVPADVEQRLAQRGVEG